MIRILFLFFIFCLTLVRSTNADFNDKKIIKSNQLTASTLDFSKEKTTDNTDINNLFNINGIIAGGYQVSTLRIKNQGEIEPFYLINFSKTNGDDNFCRQLEIEFYKNNQSIYNSDLIDLNLTLESQKNAEFIDLLVIVKLKNNFVSNKTNFCDFNMDIKASNSSNSSLSGFEYQTKISNHISSF